MPRAQNTDVKILCKKCNKYTLSIEPVEIKKSIGNRYHIKMACNICGTMKSKFMNKTQINLLPDEIKNAVDNTIFKVKGK